MQYFLLQGNLTNISRRNSLLFSTPTSSGEGNSFKYAATSWSVLFLRKKKTKNYKDRIFVNGIVFITYLWLSKWNFKVTRNKPNTQRTYDKDPKCCRRASLVSMLAMLLIAKSWSSGKYLNTARYKWKKRWNIILLIMS